MQAASFQPAFAPRPAPAPAARTMAASAPARDDGRHRELKRAIWVYFWLLIFEGALRKWTVESAANAFLVIRDPVVLWIYVLSLRDRVFPLNFGMFWTGALASAGMALMFMQIFTDQLHPVVGAYGWRSYFLHLPLVFLLPKVLNFADLQKIGRWILVISIPMALLMAAQFELPPDHILNNSAIENKLQITGGGHVRPPGTFSFITGPAQFYPWVIAYLFAALSWRAAYPVWLRLGAAVCAVLVLPLSGSRLLLFNCLIVVLVAATGFFRSEQIRRPLAFMLVLAAIALPILSFTPVFKNSVEVFQERWSNAAESEGQGRGAAYGMTVRTINDFTAIFYVIPDTPLLGMGMGMGTNVGAKLTRSYVGVQLAESEWPRLVQETGPVFGLALIFTRLGLTIFLFVNAWRAFRDDNNILAWLMFAACGPHVLYGGTAQPTALGFMCFGAGLTLAAAKSPRPSFRTVDQPWL